MAAPLASCAVVVVIAVLTLVSGSSISRRQATQGSNGVCGRSACPEYSVERQLENDIEERRYKPTQLPSYTSTQCMDFPTAVNQAYYTLAMYTRAGQNEQNTPLQMGVPVLTKVQHVDDDEPQCAQIYTTSYYVNATSFPKPNRMSAGVKIESLADTDLYVQTIGGYITDPEATFVDLRVRLNALKLCYDTKTYYIANYQSPGTETQRKNEIWVPVGKCDSPSG